jgi:hypothetical protein
MRKTRAYLGAFADLGRINVTATREPRHNESSLVRVAQVHSIVVCRSIASLVVGQEEVEWIGECIFEEKCIVMRRLGQTMRRLRYGLGKKINN